MSQTITRPVEVNLPLLREEIEAAYPELRPVPIPGAPFGASSAAFQLTGDSSETTIVLPDTFTDLAGLRDLVAAHVKTQKSQNEQKREADQLLRQSIKAKLQSPTWTPLTLEELQFLDERWRD